MFCTDTVCGLTLNRNAMENKEMLNSIDVSMFDENEVISLLLKVIELSNGKATLLNKKIEEYNLIQKKFEEDNSSLKKQVESLTEKEIKLLN